MYVYTYAIAVHATQWKLDLSFVEEHERLGNGKLVKFGMESLSQLASGVK